MLTRLTAIAKFLFGSGNDVQNRWGSFSGPVESRWLSGDKAGPDHRDMELLADFSYTDPDGLVWSVPKGAIVDGASIPRPFIVLTGGPLDGAYREASVIHDHYCVVQTRPWQETHRVFYKAMRCSGVEEEKALAMFWAVWHFGPRWFVRKPGQVYGLMETPENTRAVIRYRRPPNDFDVAWAKSIGKDRPTLAEIERMSV